jgi:hypothetical protein
MSKGIIQEGIFGVLKLRQMSMKSDYQKQVSNP